MPSTVIGLYSAEKAQSMMDDINKLQLFRPLKVERPVTCWALVSATTWFDEYARWWTVPRVRQGDPLTDHSAWVELREFANKTPLSRWGSVPISGYDSWMKNQAEEQFQHLVYCLFPIADPVL